MVAPSVFTKTDSLTVLASAPVTRNFGPMDFNLEVKPCLTSSWQQANPQFACPSGYEMIPSVANRCFVVTDTKVNKFNKKSAEYQCELNGGSLVAFETQEKLNAVTEWLKTVKKTTSKYFWLNTASQRSGVETAFNSNWTWVWVSTQSNAYKPFSYDNWGVDQSTNYNGDSVYLKSDDYKFYVGTGSQVYFNSTFESAGILCETTVTSLASNQINILLNKQTEAYTLNKQKAYQFNYTVNITLTGTQSDTQVITPSADLTKSQLGQCGKTVLDNNGANLFTEPQTFSIDLCGNAMLVNTDIVAKSLLKAWLVSRPEFIACSDLRNCVKINILSVDRINIDQVNMVTRVRYVVLVNNVIIDPSQANTYPPTFDMLRGYIDKIPTRNSLVNLRLCGVGSKQTLPIDPTSFPIVTDKNIFNKFENSPLQSAIKASLIATNPYFGQNEFSVVLDTSFKALYYRRNETRSDPNAMFAPLHQASFKILFGSAQLSYVTQSLIDLNSATGFYQNLANNGDLAPLDVIVYNPVNFHFLRKSDLINLSLQSRLSVLDGSILEGIYRKAITDYKIGKNFLNNCLSFNLIIKYLFSNL